MTTTLLTLTTTPYLALLGMECFRALYQNELLALEELIKADMDASAQELIEALDEGYDASFRRWCENGGDVFAPSSAHIKGQTVVHETCTGKTRAEVELHDDEQTTLSLKRQEALEEGDERAVMLRLLRNALEGSVLSINALELLLDEARYTHYVGRYVKEALLTFYRLDDRVAHISHKVVARFDVDGTQMVMVRPCNEERALVYEQTAWHKWLIDCLADEDTPTLECVGQGRTSRLDYELLDAYAKF